MNPPALTEPEIGVVARAVSRAPSVHNTQPWRLAVRGPAVDLLECDRRVLPVHDPAGRDRLISCGAALADLELAVRCLGREAEVEVPDTGPLVATVTAGGERAATSAELALYRSINRRRSHRRRFAPVPVDEHDRAIVVAAAAGGGVSAVEVPHSERMSGLFGPATLAFRQDRAYQRELAMWIAHTTGTAHTDGVPEAALGTGALPEAGLITATTPVPDEVVLAARFGAEHFLVLCTVDDSRRELIGAGRALQRAWLAATAQGLVGSAITQPLQLSGFRERLADRLELTGRPQALLRFGHPATVVPPSPRLPLSELFDREPAPAVEGGGGR